MNLIDNKDGTVSDLDTDLMWQQATTPGVYIWDDAVKYCKNLILAGYLDWRLPTVEELRTIIKKGSSPVIIDMDYFPDTMASHYWTSTIYKCNSNYVWFVNFNSGYEYGNCKSYYNYVRAVRYSYNNKVSSWEEHNINLLTTKERENK